MNQTRSTASSSRSSRTAKTSATTSSKNSTRNSKTYSIAYTLFSTIAKNQGYTQIVSRYQLRKLLYSLVCSNLQKSLSMKYPSSESSIKTCLNYYLRIVDKEEKQAKDILVDPLYDHSLEKILFFCNQEIYIESKENKIINSNPSYNFLFKLLKTYIKYLIETKNYLFFTEVIAQSIIFFKNNQFPDLPEFPIQQYQPQEIEKLRSDLNRIFLEKKNLKDTFLEFSKQLASKPIHVVNYLETLKQLVENDLYDLDNDLLKKLFQEQPKENRSLQRNQSNYLIGKVQEIGNRLGLDDATQLKLRNEISQYVQKYDNSFQNLSLNCMMMEGKKQVLIQVKQNKLIMEIQTSNQFLYIENSQPVRTFKELLLRK